MEDEYFKIFSQKVRDYLKESIKYSNLTDNEMDKMINEMWEENYKINIDDMDEQDIEDMLP